MLPCCTSSQGNRPCNTSPHQPLLHCPSPWPQDNLFRIFGGDRIKGLMSAFRIEDLPDRKSTRLNSSHITISYAVFCLKKKKNH